MVTAAAKQHAHKFEVDSKGRATCKCGEVREYIGYGKDATVKVIQAGDPNYRDRKPLLEDRTDEIINELTSGATKPAENIQVNIPPRPSKRKDIWKYFDSNKDQILKDYEDLKLMEFYERWRLNSNVWLKIKKRWNFTGKAPRKQNPQTGPDLERVLSLNREAIIADYHRIGEEKTLNKWGIPPEKWAEIKGKWGILGEPVKAELSTEKPENVSENIDYINIGKLEVKLIDSGLPSFPAFSNDWTEAVQLRWIDAYLELKRGGN